MEIDLPQALEARNGFTKFLNAYFDKNLDVYEIGVLLVLNYHRPKAYPSHQRIAGILKISRRQVVRAIKSLEERKLIWCEKATGKNSLYHFWSPKNEKTIKKKSPAC